MISNGYMKRTGCDFDTPVEQYSQREAPERGVL